VRQTLFALRNTRMTSNMETMVKKTAKEVVAFVDRGRTHYGKPEEEASYVQH
jgi:hypothetical protein